MEATDFTLEETGQWCRSTGLMLAAQVRGFQFVVSPGRITVIGSGFTTGGLRRIYLDRGHLKNPPMTSWGDSVGYWDGETLVVDTIGLSEESFLTLGAARHSSALRVVERWRQITAGDDTWIEREWTVDDPYALTAPYKFTRYHRKLESDVGSQVRACLGIPERRRPWVRIHNESVEFHNESRAATAGDSQATR